MSRVYLKELGFRFIESAARPVHAHDPARDLAQFFFGGFRVLDPSAPRRPQIPDPHRHRQLQLYSMEHQELPVRGELELRPVRFTHQRSVHDRPCRPRIAVTRLDRPNSIGSEPRGSPMLAYLPPRRVGKPKVSLPAEAA